MGVSGGPVIPDSIVLDILVDYGGYVLYWLPFYNPSMWTRFLLLPLYVPSWWVNQVLNGLCNMDQCNTSLHC